MEGIDRLGSLCDARLRSVSLGKGGGAYQERSRQSLLDNTTSCISPVIYDKNTREANILFFHEPRGF